MSTWMHLQWWILDTRGVFDVFFRDIIEWLKTLVWCHGELRLGCFGVLDSPVLSFFIADIWFCNDYNTKFCFGNRLERFVIYSKYKEKCVGSINSFNALILLNIFLKVTVSAIKTCSLRTLKIIIQEGFLYFLIIDAG